MKLFELKSLIREAVIKIINESDEEITYTKDGKTHRIKRSSALAYPKDHPAYKAAMKNQGKKEPEKQASYKLFKKAYDQDQKEKQQPISNLISRVSEPEIKSALKKISDNHEIKKYRITVSNVKKRGDRIYLTLQHSRAPLFWGEKADEILKKSFPGHYVDVIGGSYDGNTEIRISKK